MFGLLYAVQAPFRKTNRNLLKLLVWFIKLIIMIALAFALIAFAAPIFWRHGYPFAECYIALLADVLCDPVKAVLFRVRKKTDHKTSFILSLLSMAAVLIYGTVNMETVVPNHHVYTSDKLKQSYTAVFISDLHIGSSQSTAVVEKAFREIRELHPDFIMLGGDISDEQSENGEMKWTYEQLGKMDIPVYYIYGNHDRQPRSAYMYGPAYSREELADTEDSYSEKKACFLSRPLYSVSIVHNSRCCQQKCTGDPDRFLPEIPCQDRRKYSTKQETQEDHRILFCPFQVLRSFEDKTHIVILRT